MDTEEQVDETSDWVLEYEEPQDTTVIPDAPVSEEIPLTPEYVSKKEYDELREQIAEMRGRQAFLTEQQQRPAAPQAPIPPLDMNSAQAETALRAKLTSIGEKMYDPDRQAEGLQEFLELNSKIAQLQSQQLTEKYAGNAVNTALDLMIENFMSKKSKKDDLYPEVEARFEAELAKYDKRQVAGYSRDQLLPALENLYKAVKSDVLEEKYIAGKKKQAERRAIAPNLGGGSGSTAKSAGNSKPLSEKAKKFALAAGIKEAELSNLFAPSTEEEDEW
ncbi:MAG: hypothetical protein ACREQ5_12370 [Candidatus Dormibacteria bacterium]